MTGCCLCFTPVGSGRIYSCMYLKSLIHTQEIFLNVQMLPSPIFLFKSSIWQKLALNSYLTQCTSLTSFTPSALLTDGSLAQSIIDLALGDLENLLKCELKLHKIQKYLWEIKPKKKMLHIPVCFITILILPYHQKKIILPSPSHPCLRSQPIMKLFFVISFNNTIFYQFIICISLIALFQIYNIAFDKLVFKWILHQSETKGNGGNGTRTECKLNPAEIKFRRDSKSWGRGSRPSVFANWLYSEEKETFSHVHDRGVVFKTQSKAPTEVRLLPSYRHWEIEHYLLWWLYFRGMAPRSLRKHSWIVKLARGFLKIYIYFKVVEN